MITISSKDNAKLKLIRQLAKKKYRDSSSRFLVESKKFIMDAIDLDADIDFVAIDENIADFESIESKLMQKSIEYCIIEHKLFIDVCDTVNSQGMIAVTKQKQYEYDKDKKFILFLDDIQDPGNLGTIIRTALAFGVDLVVLSELSVDVYNTKTTRATAAAIFKQPVIRCKEKKSFLKEILDDGFKIISTVVDSDMDIKNMKKLDKVCLVIGNEGRGVSDEVKDLSHDLVTIKMSGDQESLNASIAAGISIYEIGNLLF